MNDEHGRPHLRLSQYDYASNGAYFLTICPVRRECLFGEINNEQMALNAFGRIVEEEWLHSADIRREMRFDHLVIMPNHIHGIVRIDREEEANCRIDRVDEANSRLHLQHSKSPRPPRSLSSFVAGFKAITTKRINDLRGTPGQKVWQDNFYEHIIRNEKSYFAIAEYIINNPLKWAIDRDNPANT